MKGHTSNMVLIAAIKGIIERAEAKIKEREGHPDEQEYFHGVVSGARELAIFMALDIEK